MDVIEKIKLMLENKKKQKLTPEDKEKIRIIESLIKQEKSFFQMKISTILEILKYLDATDEEAKAMIFDLLSPEQYDKTHEKVRYTISNQ
jgi:hypothetical protein